jgi:phytoene dehydrogenase-like protein
LPELRGLDPHRLGGLVSLTPNLVALERAADAAKYGEVSATPHIEICAPTVLWPELAPANRHVLLARVQYAPYHVRAGEWDDRRGEALARTVDRVLEAWIPGFSSHVLHQDVWSPRDLEQRLGLYEGASSHGELGLDQILFMRPVPGWSRYASPVAGLYLGGAGTHPGPGVLGGPGCLAARRLLADRGRTRHQEVA